MTWLSMALRQRGDHEMNISMMDWPAAREPAWKRMIKHQRLILDNVGGKLQLSGGGVSASLAVSAAIAYSSPNAQ